MLCTPMILALTRHRQKELKFEAILGYIASSRIAQTKQTLFLKGRKEIERKRSKEVCGQAEPIKLSGSFLLLPCGWGRVDWEPWTGVSSHVEVRTHSYAVRGYGARKASPARPLVCCVLADLC